MWSKEGETAGEYSHGGILFRNRPLAYWLDYVMQFGGNGSPILVVQARCDRPEDKIYPPPVETESLAAFPFKEVLSYSAKFDRGRPALDDALPQAAVWLRERQGTAGIGAGRARVKQRLESLRDEDAVRPAADRQWRTITQKDFLRLLRRGGKCLLARPAPRLSA